jgi:DNA polymerase-3 subunit epsilon
MLYDKLAILDVETTGMSAPYDRIIEIGLLRIEKGKVVKKFETLLNPECEVSPFIKNLTGISKNDIEDAPIFSDIKSDLIELLEGATFVAHNARFDYAFIKNEFKRIGIPYSAKQLCTVKLSRLLFPEFSHHNLDSIIEKFGIECSRRHRAYDDAKVLWDFLQKIEKSTPQISLEKAFKAILKKPSLPPLLKNKDIENLPEAPGIYLFFGKSEIPLYIGKSINIKERVLSHFVNDSNSSAEMEISQQVERIETIKTAGEFSALLLESNLIKKMQPLYNRKLRYARRLTFLKQKVKNGYFSVEIKSGENITHDEISEVLGIFKSKKSAKEHLANLVKEYSLCEHLTEVSKTVTPCFSYHLGICRGACIKKENTSLYNARFLIAFSKTKLKAWPFNGPIVIKEKNNDGEGDGLLFDKWCYLGKTSEYIENDVREQNAISDFDVYKILNSFLKDQKNLKKITTLNSVKDLEVFRQVN